MSKVVHALHTNAPCEVVRVELMSSVRCVETILTFVSV